MIEDQRLNSEQRRAVGVRRNAVVTAGAGSGKTTVLAERYLTLLEEGTPVEEILCLTFTRKAAAEMYERIYRSLLERQATSEAARKAVSEFEKAQISTLDSFSGRIVKSAALTLGINPDFRVDEEELRRIMEGESLRFLLKHGESDGFAALINGRGFRVAHEELLLPLSMRHFSLANEESLLNMVPRQRESLAASFDQALSIVQGQTALIATLDPGEGKTVAKAVAAMDGSGLEAGRLPEELLAEQRQRLLNGEGTDAFLSWLSELTKTIGSVPKGTGKKENALLLREAVEQLRPASERLRQIGQAVATTSAELIELLEEFRLQVVAVKRQRGLLSYQDVVELSIRALRTDRELREFYKRRFSRIMIDEFQDNNNDQRELLFLLAESPSVVGEGIPEAASLAPEKLFFVGDEKQSIYRFRGADVSVFKGLSGELLNAGGESLELHRNYRSEPKLIAAFNELFAPLFGESEEEYEARFDPLEPREEANPLDSEVHLAILDGNDHDPERQLSNAESEAYWIARKISEILDDPHFSIRDRRSGATRRPTPGDVAVLFRSTGNQYALERMLRLFGVPYGSQSIRSFFIEAPAYDIYSFVQLLLYPEDRVAYAALLRSPFLGIADDSVVQLLFDRGEAFSQAPGLIGDPGDREKYESARRRYREALRLADNRPVTELVDFLWYDAGYRQLLLSDPMNHPYLEHYDYLFQLAKRFDGRPVEEFLRGLRGSLGTFERLEELELPEGEGRVELLTIHKSKGLEFPVVFVMDIGNTGGKGGGSAFYISEEGLVVDVGEDPLSPYRFDKGGKKAGNFFVQRAKEEESRRSEAELKRLLYVAATRAESHLFLTGYIHRQNRKSEEGKSILQLLARILELDLESSGGDSGEGKGFPQSGLNGMLRISRIEHLDRVEYLSLFRGMPRGGSSGAALYAEAAISSTPTLKRRIVPSELNALAREEEDLGPLFSGAPSAPERPADRGAPAAPDASGGSAGPAAATPGADGGEWERALGTLSHRLIELRLEQERGHAIGELEAEWLSALFRGAPRERIEAAREEAGKMAERFFGSDLWKRLSKATRLETELSVLSRYDHPKLGKLFVQGQFDLYAEFDDRCEVVDFKSDRNLHPEEYRYQLALYRDAAGALSGLETGATLFGLREGRAYPVGQVPRGEMDELLERYVIG